VGVLRGKKVGLMLWLFVMNLQIIVIGRRWRKLGGMFLFLLRRYTTTTHLLLLKLGYIYLLSSYQKAADLIRSWKHFRTVIDVPTFSGTHTDWKSTSIPPLPEYIGISRISSETDAFYYHSALLFAFNTHPIPSTPPKTKRKSKGYYSREASIEPDLPAECIIYTPHGVHPSSLEPVQHASPPLKTLCFIHGLHDVSISWGQQLNLGVHNGLQAQRKLNAKYWVGTHDEVKKGGGLVGWFLNRKVLSLEKALKDEELQLNEAENNIGKVRIEDVRFEEVGNGESRILE